MFGQGSIAFFHPDNRHVAAYVREFEREVVLCVANLSHTPQAISLDLSRFAGRIPVEMTGWSAFPPIRDDHYVLTLPGYGFFWFLLAEPADAPAPAVSTDNPTRSLPEFVTLVLPHASASLLEEPARATLERDVLPGTLATNRVIPMHLPPPALTLRDVVTVEPGDEAPLLAIVTAPGDAAFVVPSELTFTGEPDWTLPTLRAAFARARWGRREGLLYDAGIDDRLWIDLFRALREGRSLPSRDGALVCEPSWSLEQLAIADIRACAARRPATGGLGGDRRHRVLRCSGDRSRACIRRSSWPSGCTTRTPPPLRRCSETSLTVDRNGLEVGVGLARRFILAQGNAWNVLHALLVRSLERRALAERAPIDRIVAAAGTRLAELHAILGAPASDPAFAPTVFGERRDERCAPTCATSRPRRSTGRARRQRRSARGAAMRARLAEVIENAPLHGSARSGCTAIPPGAPARHRSRRADRRSRRRRVGAPTGPATPQDLAA